MESLVVSLVAAPPAVADANGASANAGADTGHGNAKFGDLVSGTDDASTDTTAADEVISTAAILPFVVPPAVLQANNLLQDIALTGPSEDAVPQIDNVAGGAAEDFLSAVPLAGPQGANLAMQAGNVGVALNAENIGAQVAQNAALDTGLAPNPRDALNVAMAENAVSPMSVQQSSSTAEKNQPAFTLSGDDHLSDQDADVMAAWRAAVGSFAANNNTPLRASTDTEKTEKIGQKNSISASDFSTALDRMQAAMTPDAATGQTGAVANKPSFLVSSEAPVQNVAINVGVQHKAGAGAIHMPSAPVMTVEDQVSFHIKAMAVDGQRQITVHLEPAELGHVEIRLDVAADGKTHVAVIADNKDTLSMLQRDARALERSLQDAGVKTDAGSLNFSLRGEQQNQQNAQQQQPQKYYSNPLLEDDPDMQSVIMPLPGTQRMVAVSGLDIKV